MAVPGAGARGDQEESRHLPQSPGGVLRLLLGPVRHLHRTAHPAHRHRDNLNYVWQRDLSTGIKTVGHRLGELGYHATYQGKWHLSANLDLSDKAIDAPLGEYRKTIASYGFKDFFGVGDLIDGTLGGYSFDDTTLASTITWLRTEAQTLRTKGQPWYLAVNFVNPHDVMYFNSDLPTENVQGRSHAMGIARAPDDELYRATWDDHPLPASRHQSFDAPGRPVGQKLYQQVIDLMVGQWPDEDRRWRALRDYYFNAIRDCDRKVDALLEALAQQRHGQEHHRDLLGRSRRAGRPSPDARQGHQRLLAAEPSAADDPSSGVRGWPRMPGHHLAARPDADGDRPDGQGRRGADAGRPRAEGQGLLVLAAQPGAGRAGIDPAGVAVQLRHAVLPGHQDGRR